MQPALLHLWKKILLSLVFSGEDTVSLGHGVLWHQLKVKGYKATKQGEATSCYKNYCVLGVTPGLHPVLLGYGKSGFVLSAVISEG